MEEHRRRGRRGRQVKEKPGKEEEVPLSPHGGNKGCRRECVLIFDRRSTVLVPPSAVPPAQEIAAPIQGPTRAQEA